MSSKSDVLISSLSALELGLSATDRPLVASKSNAAAGASSQRGGTDKATAATTSPAKGADEGKHVMVPAFRAMRPNPVLTHALNTVSLAPLRVGRSVLESLSAPLFEGPARPELKRAGSHGLAREIARFRFALSVLSRGQDFERYQQQQQQPHSHHHSQQTVGDEANGKATLACLVLLEEVLKEAEPVLAKMNQTLPKCIGGVHAALREEVVRGKAETFLAKAILAARKGERLMLHNKVFFLLSFFHLTMKSLFSPWFICL